jgi:rhodanese-related sulfurtransferase
VVKPVDLDVAGFSEIIKKSPGTLLDVRTPEEVVHGKIPGAINMDFYEDDFKKQLKSLDKNKPVYVYCASGGRSGDAAEMMSEMGFTKVYNLEGGFKAWKAAGMPVVK